MTNQSYWLNCFKYYRHLGFFVIIRFELVLVLCTRTLFKSNNHRILGVYLVQNHSHGCCSFCNPVKTRNHFERMVLDIQKSLLPQPLATSHTSPALRLLMILSMLQLTADFRKEHQVSPEISITGTPPDILDLVTWQIYTACNLFWWLFTPAQPERADYRWIRMEIGLVGG